MKSCLMALFVLMALSASAGDFRRELPNQELIQAITSEKFPYADAVIIIKEQSFQIRDTEIWYRGLELHGPSSIFTSVMVVKLLTDAGVDKYGNFEFEYPEYFGDEIKCAFAVKARVLKTNRDIWILPEKEVRTIVAHTLADGSPASRKVLFKFPNLVPGDVLQIEFEYHRPFIYSSSGLFYYSDDDVVLYSNLYITLPQEATMEYFSFPGETIGEPKIEQLSDSFGAGKTYFWQVRNCNPVPAEKFAAPFTDRALLTAFVMSQSSIHSEEHCNWEYQGGSFYKQFLDKQNVGVADIKELGINPEPADSVTFEMVDSLYTMLRRKFQLFESNELYSSRENIRSALKIQKGDASDLACIMFNILREWKQRTNIVWIRDLREGIFEKTVPTSEWFDRCAVMVNIGNREKIYDFDYSLPYKYEVPWYFKNITIPVIDAHGAYLKPAPLVNMSNLYRESHNLSVDAGLGVNDKAVLYYKGSAAQRFRYKAHAWDQTAIREEVAKSLLAGSVKSFDHLEYSDFMTNSDIRLEVQGVSACQPEVIDSFLVLVLKSDLIAKFRTDLFSTVRYSHLLFDGPFNLQLMWNINIPAGYDFIQGPVDRIITRAGKVDSQIFCTADSQQVHLNVNIKFPSTMIEKSKLPELLSLLDDTISQTSMPVKFRKKEL